MARRPTRGSSGSRGNGRGSNARGAGGRGAGGRGGRGRPGGGSDSSAMYIGIGAVAVIAVAVFAFMGADDDNDGGPPKIDTKEKAKVEKESADALWKNGKTTPAETTKKAGRKWGDFREKYDKSEFREYMSQVDRTIWNQVEDLFVEARKLKAKAFEARKAGDEKEFEKLMGEAVRTWRKGDLKSEEFSESIELIKKDMWDAMFKDEQKKLEHLTKEFRAYIMYEEKHD